jgi:hypothetical protein
METPDEIGTTCREQACPKAPEVAGWCPGHAIERYKRQAVRVTPARYLGHRSRQVAENDD